MPDPGSSLSQNTRLPRSTVRRSIVLLFGLTAPTAALSSVLIDRKNESNFVTFAHCLELTLL